MSRPSVLPHDNEHRRLCHRLFDAIETADLDTVAVCLSPDVEMWFNVTDSTSDRDATLAALSSGYEWQRRRTYNDRQIHTFDDGFLARYTLNVVMPDGSTTALWACLVATVHDGLIVRMDEYLDSSKFVPRRPKWRRAS